MTATSTFLVGCSSIDRIIFEPEQQSLSEVVIIGGGLAGLAAALELKKKNVSYTLFEASFRLGGRVLSRRELNSNADLTTTELGMATYSVNDTALVNLIKELKVQSSMSSSKTDFKVDPGFSQVIEALKSRVAGVPEERFLKVSSAITSMNLDGDFFALDYVVNSLVQTRRAAKVIIAVPPSQLKFVIKNLNSAFSEKMAKFSQTILMAEDQVAGFNWKQAAFIQGGRSVKSETQIIPESEYFYFKQGEKYVAVIGDYTSQRYFGRGAGAVESAKEAVDWMTA